MYIYICICTRVRHRGTAGLIPLMDLVGQIRVSRMSGGVSQRSLIYYFSEIGAYSSVTKPDNSDHSPGKWAITYCQPAPPRGAVWQSVTAHLPRLLSELSGLLTELYATITCCQAAVRRSSDILINVRVRQAGPNLPGPPGLSTVKPGSLPTAHNHSGPGVVLKRSGFIGPGQPGV